MKILLIDTTGKTVRSFSSLQEAINFKALNNRYDWSIKKAYKRKAYCSANRKALLNYFIKTSFKVMGILKFNAQMNKEKNTKPKNKQSSEDTTACPSANLYF